jgi:hypothetical protein
MIGKKRYHRDESRSLPISTGKFQNGTRLSSGLGLQFTYLARFDREKPVDFGVACLGLRTREPTDNFGRPEKSDAFAKREPSRDS